jgi:hypothetical protein
MGMKKMEFQKLNKKLNAETNSGDDTFIKKTKLDQLADNSNQMSILFRRIENIEKILNNIWDETKDKFEEELKEIKWKYAGIVIDKLFFYLSIIYFLCTFFPLIFSMANFYNPQ